MRRWRKMASTHGLGGQAVLLWVPRGQGAAVGQQGRPLAVVRGRRRAGAEARRGRGGGRSAVPAQAVRRALLALVFDGRLQRCRGRRRRVKNGVPKCPNPRVSSRPPGTVEEVPLSL